MSHVIFCPKPGLLIFEPLHTFHLAELTFLCANLIHFYIIEYKILSQQVIVTVNNL